MWPVESIASVLIVNVWYVNPDDVFEIKYFSSWSTLNCANDPREGVLLSTFADAKPGEVNMEYHVLKTCVSPCFEQMFWANWRQMKNSPFLHFYYYLFNPLNPELNPICYLLALLGFHHFLHVSRITLRLLMSYIYGAPILDVSRSHTTTHHSR